MSIIRSNFSSSFIMVLSIMLFISIITQFVIFTKCEDSNSIPTFNEDFIKKPYFVDKTEFLGEFFKNKYGSDYNYVSYPSKFGKTINLQMIKCFCQVHLDSKKNPLNWTRTTSFKLFKDLKISQNREVFSTHLAQHPVIWLDLNFTIELVVSEEQLIIGLNKQIQKCYLEYRWLVDLAKTSDMYHYNKSMEKALDGTLNAHELVHSLAHLAHLLKDYFKMGVVLLIDNYDLIINTLFVAELKERIFLKPLTRAMVKASLRPEEHFVTHAVIAGISLWNYNLKEDENVTALQKLISVKTNPFLLDDRFFAYFGFTELEIQAICDQYKCTDDEKWLLKQLYDGYTNPNLSSSGLRSIYNPYSVTEFIAHRQTEIPFRNYWIRSQDINFIYLLLRGLHFRKQFVELLKYDSIVMGPRTSLPTSYCTFDHLRTWYEPYNSSLLGYFFDCGYLTYDSRDFNKVRIPNDDIRQFLSSVLIEFYKENNYSIDKLRKYFDELVVNKIIESEQMLPNLKLHLQSTLKLMNSKYGLQMTTTSPSSVSINCTNDTASLVWIFKPQIIRVEVHNIIMAVALQLHLTGKEILVARISRKYPEQDHILLYDRNETLIVRIKNQSCEIPVELPPALRDALLPEMSRMHVKILDVIINDRIELDLRLNDYHDNRSFAFCAPRTMQEIKLQTLFPT